MQIQQLEYLMKVVECGSITRAAPLSYKHLTLPTTPYV